MRARRPEPRARWVSTMDGECVWTMDRTVGALQATTAVPVGVRARRGLVCARGVDGGGCRMQLAGEVLAVERPAAFDALHFLAAPASGERELAI